MASAVALSLGDVEQATLGAAAGAVISPASACTASGREWRAAAHARRRRPAARDGLNRARRWRR
jgi:hypothetical protein